MPKSLTNSKDYKSLLAKVSRELLDIEVFVKQRMTEGYWKVGKYIDEHLLEHKDRADYGKTFFVRLSKDIGRDKSTLLRAVKFYRTYPIVADQPQLSWDHYKRLITVEDSKERKRLEQKVIQNDWSTTKLGEYLHQKRAVETSDGKPIPQLVFTRGKINICRVVKGGGEFPLALDLGFRLKHALPKAASKAKEGDILELGGFKKVQAKDDELFTYKAKIEKIIDGDTLQVVFDFGLDFTISQKLRLRGIDCPEMDTDEGKKAKRFVEACFKGLNFIIVKTYKDRSDKFDRYLADVFYAKQLPQEREAASTPRAPKGRVGVSSMLAASDPSLVAREGKYLNQELLNERLAVRYE